MVLLRWFCDEPGGMSVLGRAVSDVPPIHDRHFWGSGLRRSPLCAGVAYVRHARTLDLRRATGGLARRCDHGARLRDVEAGVVSFEQPDVFDDGRRKGYGDHRAAEHFLVETIEVVNLRTR
jgi:hypothetical protein